MLFALSAAMLVHAAWTDFVVVDEAAQLASGLAHWQTGDFRPYHVNPPLVRLLGTAPLLAMDVQVVVAENLKSPLDRPEWALGSQFAQVNAPRYMTIVRISRWVSVLLTAATGWLLWTWGRELHGTPGGLLSLSLWTFCPLALGHGHFLTNDVAAACFGLLAHRAFCQYRRHPNSLTTLWCGLTLGLAVLAKFTMFVLIPAWLLIGLFDRVRRLRGLASRKNEKDVSAQNVTDQLGATSAALVVRAFLRDLSRWALGALSFLAVVQLGYGFSEPVTRLGDIQFISRSLGGGRQDAKVDSTTFNRFRGTIVENLPVPLPRELVLGIDQQKRDFESGSRSYLLGEIRNRGWWYYYLYGLAVKMPVGHLVLVLAAFTLSLVRREYSPDGWILWLPAFMVIGLVSSQTGFNHHLRYCLPALPFMYLCTGSLGRFALAHGRWSIATVSIPVLASAISVMLNHPHHISYFNELAGGSRNGHLHLLDSNVDWGQDLLRLRDWLSRHPEARPLFLRVFHLVDPSTLDIEYEVPPQEGEPLKEGWYVVSANVLHGYAHPIFASHRDRKPFMNDAFGYLRQKVPVARIGRSLWVFEIERSEASRE
jgi:hypothetical protein